MWISVFLVISGLIISVPIYMMDRERKLARKTIEALYHEKLYGQQFKGIVAHWKRIKREYGAVRSFKVTHISVGPIGGAWYATLEVNRGGVVAQEYLLGAETRIHSISRISATVTE